MDPIPSTTADIMKFYYEENRDPRLARELCLSIGLERLYEYMQTDVEDGFDSDTLGLMKAFGINLRDFVSYSGGEYFLSVPEDVQHLQRKMGTQATIDTDNIVDYIFRSSVQFVIDTIDGDRQIQLFEDIQGVVNRDQIDPAWIWEVILDRVIYPGVRIEESVMNEIMPVLAETYVSVIAYSRR